MVEIQEQQKICSTCKILKPFSEFYKDKRTKDGLYSNCKMCAKKATMKSIDKMSKLFSYEQRARNKQYMKKWGEGRKEYFREASRKWREGHREQVLEYKRQWRMAHKESANESTKKWKKKHPESVRRTNAKWALKNPDKIKSYRERVIIDPIKARAAARKYQASHREEVNASNKKWREKNVEKHRAATKKWRLNHLEQAKANYDKWRKKYPEKMRVFARMAEFKRRKRIQSTGGVWPINSKIFGILVKRQFKENLVGICPYCLKNQISTTSSLDHIEPVNRWENIRVNLSHTNNLIFCCKSCNSKKQAKFFSEWLRILDRGDLNQLTEIALKIEVILIRNGSTAKEASSLAKGLSKIKTTILKDASLKSKMGEPI